METKFAPEFLNTASIAPTTTATANAPPQSSAAERRRDAILLVSEDAGFAESLGRAVDVLGLALLQVNESRKVLRQVGRIRPAVVFLDLDLPAQAGWEAADRLLLNEPPFSIILLTGRTNHFDLSTAIRAGLIVDKAASPAQLLGRMNRILAELDSDRLERIARQQLLIRWLRPCAYSVPVSPMQRFWGINE